MSTFHSWRANEAAQPQPVNAIFLPGMLLVGWTVPTDAIRTISSEYQSAF
jgi:hypothetical protein